MTHPSWLPQRLARSLGTGTRPNPMMTNADTMASFYRDLWFPVKHQSGLNEPIYYWPTRLFCQCKFNGRKRWSWFSAWIERHGVLEGLGHFYLESASTQRLSLPPSSHGLPSWICKGNGNFLSSANSFTRPAAACAVRLGSRIFFVITKW